MKTLTILGLLLATFSYTFGAETKVESDSKSDIQNRFLELVYDKAVKYTEKGELALEKAVELVANETPILMQEFLAYRFFYHTITFSGVLVFIIVSFFVVLFLWWKWAKTEYDEYSNWAPAAIICGVIVLVGGAIAIKQNSHHLMSAVQIKVAPRIYIIEQTVELFKK